MVERKTKRKREAGTRWRKGGKMARDTEHKGNRKERKDTIIFITDNLRQFKSNHTHTEKKIQIGRAHV